MMILMILMILMMILMILMTKNASNKHVKAKTRRDYNHKQGGVIIRSNVKQIIILMILMMILMILMMILILMILMVIDHWLIIDWSDQYSVNPTNQPNQPSTQPTTGWR